MDIHAAITLAYVDPTSVEAARVLVDRLKRDDDHKFVDAFCIEPLLHLGEVAGPILADALEVDRPQRAILGVLSALRSKGTAAGPKLIVAIRHQQERGFNTQQEGTLLRTAGAVGADPKVVIPVAVEVVKKHGTRTAGGEALEGLRLYGPAAKEALPFLRTRYGENEYTDRKIARAVLRIDPEDSKARAVLIRALAEPDDPATAEVARDALIENGKYALVDLEKAAADTMLPGPVRGAAYKLYLKLRSP